MTINDPRDSPEYQVGGDKFKGKYENTGTDVPPQVVKDFHKRADTDSSAQAIHHTLGMKAGQASPGDHRHDGASSIKILKGTTITGSRSGGSALVSIIDALEKLGATDSTTA
jgi:hypothetical protein